MSKFDQKQFLDDYFFLEGVNNRIESAQRILSQVKIKKAGGRFEKKKNRNKGKAKKQKFNQPQTTEVKDQHQQ